MTISTTTTSLDGSSVDSAINARLTQYLANYHNGGETNFFLSFAYHHPVMNPRLGIGGQFTVTFSWELDAFNVPKPVIDSIFVGPSVEAVGPGFTYGILPTGNATSFANHFGITAIAPYPTTFDGALGVGVGVTLGDGPRIFGADAPTFAQQFSDLQNQVIGRNPLTDFPMKERGQLPISKNP